MKEDERKGNIEVRFNDDDSVDEIVIFNLMGRCIFHLEQMDDNFYWMRAYGEAVDLVAHIGAKIEDGNAVVWSNNEWESAHLEKWTQEKYTPEAKRREEVSELIARYGLSVLLTEISEIIKSGEKQHKTLAEELIKTRDRFIADDEIYWQAY